MNKVEKKTQGEVKYDVYLDERRALIEAEKSSSQQFDKAILTLAAGALAISLTFIQHIVPHPKNWTVYFLSFSWLTFIISILSTLCSFLTSQSACSRQREILEKEFFSSSENEDHMNTMAIWTKGLNWLSISSFILGVILLAVFSIANITDVKGVNMAQKDKTKKIDEGFVPAKVPKKPDLEKKGYIPPPPPKKPDSGPKKDK